MSTKLRGSRLIDICTPSISYDRQVQSGCFAFDNQMWAIIDDTPQIIFISDILNLTDEKLVDILAWQFHVDFYDPTKNLEFKRQLVWKSIEWHRRKGTVALVQEVLDTYFPKQTTLQEWFQYMDPLPPNYPVDDPDAIFLTFAPSDVNVGANKFNISGHGLTNGQQISFRTHVVTAGSKLPSPLLVDVYYFIVNAVTNSFQVSISSGGAPVDMTDSGSGTNELWKRGAGSWHDRYRFRVIIDDQLVDPDDLRTVMELIDAYKPVSRWLEGFIRAITSECDIGWRGAMLRFIYRESAAPFYRFDESTKEHNT